MKLHELEVYQRSMDVTERICVLISTWDIFNRDIPGQKTANAKSPR